MRRWIEFFWLTALVCLLAYFAIYYKILPLRSKVAVGVGIFVAAMLYSYRNALRKKQQRDEQNKGEE